MDGGVDEGVVAFIDVGTNSIRLIVAQIRIGGGFTILREEKEVIRLGERIFIDGFINNEAMGRAVAALRKFAKIARGFQVDDIVAVATSAVREANNQREFLGLIRNRVGLEVRVVSGMEEARLIYLGVSSGINIGEKLALFVDIGGGSTELILGDQHTHRVLASTNLGAIRLTSLFIPRNWTKEIEEKTVEKMRSYVRAELRKATESFQKSRIEVAYGSSGTIINLAEMAKKASSRERLTLKLKDLKKLSDTLCSLPLEERRKYPDINPERADIIIGGAVILETVMDDLKVPIIRVSNRGLNYGLLVDYLSKINGGIESKQVVRERSILDLGHAYNINNNHTENVTRISLQLFDSSKATKLQDLGDWEREILRYAALLHDIGNAISYRDHNLHGEYIIRNSELLGFDQSEISLIATIVRYHMKHIPTRKELLEINMDKKRQKVVQILSAFLRIAENLDRSHLGRVKRVEFTVNNVNKTTMTLYADEDIDVELWGIESVQDCFKTVFRKRLKIDILPTQLAE